jgi:hypothetical protein
MKNKFFGTVIIMAAGLLAAPTAHSQGTVYISSLGQPPSGSEAVGSDSWQADLFATGNNPGGYALDSIQLAMTPATGDPSGFTVQLYTAGNYLGAPAPGSSLGTLTGSSDPVTAGLYNYAASGLMLSPSSDYFIVLTAGTSVANGAFAWSTEDIAAPVYNGGWPIGDYRVTSSDGLTWHSIAGGVPQFELTATAVPEPDTFVLMGLPGLLFFVWRGWRARAQAR